MSQWPTSPAWNGADSINSGNQFERSDGLRSTDLNKIVQNVLFLKNEILDPQNTKLFKYRGSVTTYEELQVLTSPSVGDVYNVIQASTRYPAETNFVWNGTDWDSLGGIMDLSNLSDGNGDGSVEQRDADAVGKNSASFGVSKVNYADGKPMTGVKVIRGYDPEKQEPIKKPYGSTGAGSGSTGDLTPEEQPDADSVMYYKDGNQILSNFSIEFESTGAIGENAFTSGENNLAAAKNSRATGWNTYAGANYASTEGSDNIAVGEDSHAEGLKNASIGQATHTEGMRNTAEGKNSHIEGLKNHTSTNAVNSHVEGSYNNCRSSNTHIEGIWNVAIGSASHSHIEGEGNTVQGVNSHAEGEFTVGIGKAVHTEGSGSVAQGDYSHAEGKHLQCKADDGSYLFSPTVSTNATYGHLTGISTTTKDGDPTTSTGAKGAYAHAEGNQTLAYGGSSHAEGFKSYAKGTYSHAEGQTNLAEGAATHAEGNLTTAKGDYSHSEGQKTVARGKYSHAEGQNTIATADCQHVQGRFNVVDSNGDYLHIVGKGTSDGNRSNAHTIDKNGNAWFAGDVYVGGTGQSAGAEKLAKMSDLAGVVAGNVPVATTQYPGIVQPGDYINIDSDGKISVAMATSKTPGVVTSGDTIRIDDNGQLTLLPPVRVDMNITVSGGSVPEDTILKVAFSYHSRKIAHYNRTIIGTLIEDLYTYDHTFLIPVVVSEFSSWLPAFPLKTYAGTLYTYLQDMHLVLRLDYTRFNTEEKLIMGVTVQSTSQEHVYMDLNAEGTDAPTCTIEAYVAQAGNVIKQITQE